VLVVQPNDSQFTDILKNAGIEVTQHSKDILEDLDAGPAPKKPPLAPIEPDDPYSKWRKLV
jgi:hypothetical protein